MPKANEDDTKTGEATRRMEAPLRTIPLSMPLTSKSAGNISRAMESHELLRRLILSMRCGGFVLSTSLILIRMAG